MPGSQGLLPAPSPLRTVRESFPSHGSSLDKMPLSIRQPTESLFCCLHDPCLQTAYDALRILPIHIVPAKFIAHQVVNGQNDCHCLSAPFGLNPCMTYPVIQDLSEVCLLSEQDICPYPIHYRPAFAFSDLPYPLACRLSLLIAFPETAWETIGLNMFRSHNTVG